eukprot:jgi/Botrbrau1/15909/Bobra.40_1s0091.1
MVEGGQAVNTDVVQTLHNVLRPFLLRRLKADVEKQLPQKHEHVVHCRLSKRQRQLYDEYLASSGTTSVLSSGNFLGIINVLMQLRKCCNHPDLFEGRPIVSAFDMLPALETQLPSAALSVTQRPLWERLDLEALGFLRLTAHPPALWEVQEVQELQRREAEVTPGGARVWRQKTRFDGVSLEAYYERFAGGLRVASQPDARQAIALVRAAARHAGGDRARKLLDAHARNVALSGSRGSWVPLIGRDTVKAVSLEFPVPQVHHLAQQRGRHLDFPNCLASAIKTYEDRASQEDGTLQNFMFVIPKARAPPPVFWCSRPDPALVSAAARAAAVVQREFFVRGASLRTAIVRQQVFFPDRRLIQYDCGKLQELAELLAKLKAGKHKALIFTQMAKMLDILEVFLNLHGYTYLRLDGTTRPEQRQILMQRFNSNPKIFVFILSTRSGGVGMNLTGADTVIFYDSDWNPAMDAQAQDRCHRIGQTREVHIYRLVSENTIEENILRKSDQKRQLDHLAIQSGGFNTEVLEKFNPRELLGLQGGSGAVVTDMSAEEMNAAMRSVEDEGDAAAAAALEQETAAELAEFTAEGVGPSEAAEGEEGDEDADGDDPNRPRVVRDATPGSNGALVTAAPAAVPTAGAGPSAASAPPAGSVPPAGSARLAGAGAVTGLGEDVGEDVLEDVKKMMLEEDDEGDFLQKLDRHLKPIEKYAVRYIEELMPELDVEAEAAEVEKQLDDQEWNFEQIERLQEEQEAELDEEGEAVRIAEWDRQAADAAYREKVAHALEAERQRLALLEEEEPGGRYAEVGRGRETPSSSAPTRKSQQHSRKRNRSGSEADSARFAAKRFPALKGRQDVRPHGRGSTPKRKWVEEEEDELYDNGYADEDEEMELYHDVGSTADHRGPAYTGPGGGWRPPSRKRRAVPHGSHGPSHGQPHAFPGHAPVKKMRSTRESKPRAATSFGRGGSERSRPWLSPTNQGPTSSSALSLSSEDAYGQDPGVDGPLQPAGSEAACEEEGKLEYSPTGPVPPPPSSTTAPAPLYSIPRPPPQIMVPWESAEDLVLAGAVHRETLPPEEAHHPPSQLPVPGPPPPPVLPQAQGVPPLSSTAGASLEAATRPVQISDAVWQRISEALHCGATTSSLPIASQILQSKKRSPEQCKKRYAQLVRARRGAVAQSATDGPDWDHFSHKLYQLLQDHSLKTEVVTRLISEAGTRMVEAQPITPTEHGFLQTLLQELQRIEVVYSSPATVAANGVLEGEDAKDVVVNGEEAKGILDMVARSNGSYSRSILRQLYPLLDALLAGGVAAGHAKMLQLLQEPAPPPVPHVQTVLPAAIPRPVGVGPQQYPQQYFNQMPSYPVPSGPIAGPGPAWPASGGPQGLSAASPHGAPQGYRPVGSPSVPQSQMPSYPSPVPQQQGAPGGAAVPVVAPQGLPPPQQYSLLQPPAAMAPPHVAGAPSAPSGGLPASAVHPSGSAVYHPPGSAGHPPGPAVHASGSAVHPGGPALQQGGLGAGMVGQPPMQQAVQGSMQAVPPAGSQSVQQPTLQAVQPHMYQAVQALGHHVGQAPAQQQMQQLSHQMVQPAGHQVVQGASIQAVQPSSQQAVWSPAQVPGMQPQQVGPHFQTGMAGYNVSQHYGSTVMTVSAAEGQPQVAGQNFQTRMERGVQQNYGGTAATAPTPDGQARQAVQYYPTSMADYGVPQSFGNLAPIELQQCRPAQFPQGAPLGPSLPNLATSTPLVPPNLSPTVSPGALAGNAVGGSPTASQGQASSEEKVKYFLAQTKYDPFNPNGLPHYSTYRAASAGTQRPGEAPAAAQRSSMAEASSGIPTGHQSGVLPAGSGVPASPSGASQVPAIPLGPGQGGTAVCSPCCGTLYDDVSWQPRLLSAVPRGGTGGHMGTWGYLLARGLSQASRGWYRWHMAPVGYRTATRLRNGPPQGLYHWAPRLLVMALVLFPFPAQPRAGCLLRYTSGACLLRYTYSLRRHGRSPRRCRHSPSRDTHCLMQYHHTLRQCRRSLWGDCYRLSQYRRTLRQQRNSIRRYCPSLRRYIYHLSWYNHRNLRHLEQASSPRIGQIHLDRVWV